METFNEKSKANSAKNLRIDCVLRDKNGVPVCFMKSINTEPNFQNNQAIDRKIRSEFLSLEKMRSEQNTEED